MPEAEKEEQRDRQAENLYLITSWINWKKEGRALAACNLNGLEPAVAASIRALAITRTSWKPLQNGGSSPSDWPLPSLQHGPWSTTLDWDQSTERHADRVRRRLLKGVIATHSAPISNSSIRKRTGGMYSEAVRFDWTDSGGIRKGIRLLIRGSEPAQHMFARKH